VAVGFIVTALASAADAVMHALSIFPSSPRPMSGPLFALASAYRAVFTVAGGFVTAQSGSRPSHAPCVDPGGINLVAGLAGIVAYDAIGDASNNVND
jgi:hypothetical protein